MLSRALQQIGEAVQNLGRFTHVTRLRVALGASIGGGEQILREAEPSKKLLWVPPTPGTHKVGAYASGKRIPSSW